MKTPLFALAAALMMANPFLAVGQTSAPAGSLAPYAVFVDQPTGFTFINLPSGWKFVGAVSKEEAQHVPANVLTSVLPAGSERTTNTAPVK
ncbi:hypothetical protein AB4Y32_38495 [Paraburkholderia phymatum]|uniref:Uncharacterized protein n=1 Tax=Paraburkholderia phymatum TaxID=148447 RepID=A0ACC6UCW9_9BURK